MKKISWLILILLFAGNLAAQTISSFTVIPANPTTSDTITVVIQSVYTSSDCDGTAYLDSISGNQISAGALHCMGMLAMPCFDLDTIVIPPLAAGTYSFFFALVTGETVGCIPGIIPPDFDSTSFTVSGSSGIINVNQVSFHLFPNPTPGKIFVRQSLNENAVLKIYSPIGKLINTFSLDGFETEINLDLPAGVYPVVYENKEGRVNSMVLVLNLLN